MQPETDLDLDLNLPEAPKTDDRLQQEDKKNQEIHEEAPVQQPSTTIEELPTPTNTENIEKVIEPKTLQENMHIIDQLTASASSGGLAPEANIAVQTPPTIDTPKTFDLDAMLGTTPNINQTENLSVRRGNEGEVVVTETPLPTNISTEQKTEIPTMQAEPMPAQAFTLPTTETTTPTAAIIQTNIPSTPILHKKNIGVKVLLFSVLFVALGFTSYFILQTMYPLEFAQLFNRENRENTENMHASEEILPEITT